MKKLTVVICTYNEECSILTALKSLRLNKIYKATEIILIDDCSTNPVTLRILSLLEKLTDVKLTCCPKNMGLSNSRNLGFQNATTEYVVPLDGDDSLPPGTLDDVYETFIERSDADFIIGNYLIQDAITKAQSEIVCESITVDGMVDKKKLALNWILLGTSPCKKATWERVGGYNLKYSYTVQDIDFWIRVVQADFKGCYIDKSIYIWNKSPNGMNSSLDNLSLIRLLEEHRDFYLTISTSRSLNNKLFEGFYPCKDRALILPIGRKYFLELNLVNKLRFIKFNLEQAFKLRN